jgi:hypothetical protein
MQITLNRPQSLAHQALLPGNNVTVPWGRGIGKSWFERLAGWYEPVARWDGVVRPTTGGESISGVRIVHLMPTFKACRDVHEEKARNELENAGAWSFLGARVDHTRWHFTFPGGSWIQWFGAREANSARGIRCDIVTADEADDIDPEVLDAVVAPWFSEPWSLRMMLLGGTPRRGRYGLLYREHKAGLDGAIARATPLLSVQDPEERKKLVAVRRCYSFHATYRDAPETVDPGYVEDVRVKTLPAVFKREWECDFDSAEGLVYSMFDESLHVRRPAAGTRWTEILFGVDHGWEDPGVILAIGVAGSGKDATCHVLEEVYEQHQLESWWIEKAKSLRVKYQQFAQRWYGDPSRPDRIKAIERGAQVKFLETNNAIEDGVSAVADRLAPRPDPDDITGKRRFARLYIDPSCKFTRWEMVNYRRKRDPSNEDRFLESIEDKSNHANDALRYACFNRFGSPVTHRSMSFVA